MWGGMLAVIDLAEDRIKSLLQTNGLDSIDFANFNSPKQIVLSGPAADIAKANEILAQEALMCAIKGEWSISFAIYAICCR